MSRVTVASGPGGSGAASRSPEAEGDEVPGSQEGGDDAAGEPDEQRIDACGGTNFRARDVNGAPETGDREDREKNCGSEDESGAAAGDAKAIECLNKAEECCKQRDDG